MVVSELITELEKLPQDAWLDAMFEDGGADAYAVVGVDSISLSDGRTIAVLDITSGNGLALA